MSFVYEIPNKDAWSQLMNQQYHIVIVKLYGDWCQPCKHLNPHYEAMAQSYKDNQNILFCSLNEKLQLLTENLRGVPCIRMFINGQHVESMVGGNPNKVRSFIEKYAGPPPTQAYSNPNVEQLSSGPHGPHGPNGPSGPAQHPSTGYQHQQQQRQHQMYQQYQQNPNQPPAQQQQGQQGQQGPESSEGVESAYRLTRNFCPYKSLSTMETS